MKKDAEYFGSLQKSCTFAPANETIAPLRSGVESGKLHREHVL